MPALKPTQYHARILWLGAVASRKASLVSDPKTEMPLSFAGYDAEDHAGLTRPSCSRVLAQYPRGTQIRNTRQLSIMSREDMDAIAADLGLGTLAPQLLGTSVLIEGIPDWTHVPPSSRLVAENGGPGIIVDMENRPCKYPGDYIEQAHPGAGQAFKAAAKGRRGVTASVEREGTLRVGDVLRLHIPDQPQWAGLTGS